MPTARPPIWTATIVAAAALCAAVVVLHEPEPAAAAAKACKIAPSSTWKSRAVGRVARRMRAALGKCSTHTATNVVADAPDPAPPPCTPFLAAAPGAEMNEATFTSKLSMRSTGTLRAVVLFVDFPDLVARESTSQLASWLGPNSEAWVSEVSGGRMSLQFTPVHRWYRLARNFRSYGLGDGVSFDEQRSYIAEAVRAADAEVDFTPYDVVYVVAARGTDLERSPAFHAYRGDGVFADGHEIRYGATFGEDIRDGARYASHVLLHETGHVMGLPDLYDVPQPEYWSLLRYAGGWDMMSWTTPGAHFTAWHKWKLGWLEPTQLTCLNGPGEVTTTLSPLAADGGLKAVVVPTGPSSAYVIEARRRIRQDSRLCEDGVLVYTVDASVRSGYGPVRVHAAQAGSNGDSINRCGPLYNAPFDAARGEIARFADAAAGVTMQVLKASTAGYRVRVTRTSALPVYPPASVEYLLSRTDYEQPEEG